MKSNKKDAESATQEKKTPKKKKGITPLQWAAEHLPEFPEWHSLLADWLSLRRSHNLSGKYAIKRFFNILILKSDLPRAPHLLLKESTNIPDFKMAFPELSHHTCLTHTCYTRSFLSYVLECRFSEIAESGEMKFLSGYRNPLGEKVPRRRERIFLRQPHNSGKLSKISEIYPHLKEWGDLAEKWLETKKEFGNSKRKAIWIFIDNYLADQILPTSLEGFFTQNANLPDFYQTACVPTIHGKRVNNVVSDFLDFVISEKTNGMRSNENQKDALYVNPVGKLVELQPTKKPGKKRRTSKYFDKEFSWIKSSYPQLEHWTPLVKEWIDGEERGLHSKIAALDTFFGKYIIALNLPVDPAVLLSRTTRLPDFFDAACSKITIGSKKNNAVLNFLDFVLLKEFSFENDYGERLVSPAFWNPISHRTGDGSSQNCESVRVPLPYGYLDEARSTLAEGPNFRDWKTAQTLHGGGVDESEVWGADWFEVSPELIDKSDPDCVWAVKKTRNGKAYAMWSPVRWVAILTKMIMPLRTLQVCMLDSGEADTWRYKDGVWIINKSPLAEGSKKKPLQLGVFRRKNNPIGENISSTVLYINTNKTADIGKWKEAKGYEAAWPEGGQINANVFYWLEKLRNWQEKYNPISRRTSWFELEARHGVRKSEKVLASYADTCFLFRMAEHSTNKHLPISTGLLDWPWFIFLRYMEEKISRRGETHPNGDPIRLINPNPEAKLSYRTNFPLHSLRVSIITALALEADVPFPLLQKLVGHSRLLMTIYYTKPDAGYMRDVLRDATVRLDEKKEESILNFLSNASYKELVENAICNNTESLSSISEHPANRNAAGWMLMHHGLCLVGGNTSEDEGGNLGGCYNGGPALAASSGKKLAHGPVPGGSRNCTRCRWFVTEPHYLPALVAHFNSVAYHFDEARNASLRKEQDIQDLKRQRMDAEESGLPFTKLAEFRQTERTWEQAMKRFNDLAEDLVACWRLIERCKKALDSPSQGAQQLILSGTIEDANIVFEETESELLQLAGICDSAELYPDIAPGKSVFRRSQLLDGVLYRDDLKPVFMHLSEHDQLIIGNAFMRKLSLRMNPNDTVLGRREVIRLIDAGASLSDYFEVDLLSLVRDSESAGRLSSEKSLLGRGSK